MSLPVPKPGLVIGYSYLWSREHGRGAQEGAKNRPCAIIAARQVVAGREVVTVLPITHSPPVNPLDAVEIPAAIKKHLELDDFPSWVVIVETNDFLWPGPDLRPVPGAKPPRFEYGMLPPRFFTHVRDRVLAAHRSRRLAQVPRTE